MNKKAALITGSAKRIGREMAILLALKGFDIAINFHNSKEEALDLQNEIITKYNVRCGVFQADLQDSNQAKKLIADVIKIFPYLSLLINNASIFRESRFVQDDENEMLANLNIHFISPMILAREFAKNIAQQNISDAQIINMIDKNIARFDTNYFYYLLSKKNLAELTKMLALELAPKIRVNAIAPGFILNNINEQNPSSEYVEKLTRRIPLKRKGCVENICQTLDFLVTNYFINGEIIFVDGGASLNHAG